MRLALPAEEQVAVDDRALELFVHEREQLRKLRVEALEALRLVDVGIRRGVAADHDGELFGVSHGAVCVRLRLIGGFFLWHEHGVRHSSPQRGQRCEREITGVKFHYALSS